MTTSDPNFEHWNAVYLARAVESVSWYRPHLDHSWRLLDGLGLAQSTRIIDVGGGASTFVDDALARGLTRVTVLDLAHAALDVSRARLGELGSEVQWVVGDITATDLGQHTFDVWHDRAVFHFLTDTESQARYMHTLHQAVAPNGYVVLATFGRNGPERCSGLPTLRLTTDELFERLPRGFERVSTSIELHTTPSGGSQEFSYLLAKRS